MENIISKETYKNYTIKILPDLDPLNPRTEWDNLGTMACFHRRYLLGDSNIGFSSNDFNSWEEMLAFIEKDAAVVLPIYMYDHSGITISSTPFHCTWDSGQIGFIYATKEQARKEYGVKRISAKLKETITKVLEGEIETYDKFISGECVSFKVENEEEDIIDSCSGFFSEEEALEYAKDSINHLAA